MSKVEQAPTTGHGPDPRLQALEALLGQGDPRRIEAVRIAYQLQPREGEAWLRCGERMAAGMLAAEAEAVMRAELARHQQQEAP